MTQKDRHPIYISGQERGKRILGLQSIGLPEVVRDVGVRDRERKRFIYIYIVSDRKRDREKERRRE